jgi:hypothetical protein
MNDRKQYPRKAATLAQMIIRRVLKTFGSGADSTTTAGGRPAGLTAAFGAGGVTAVAGGTATAELSSFKLLSTYRKPPPLTNRFPADAAFTLQRRGLRRKLYNSPRHRD